mmetsp:Transcript_32909/g.82671  ORF Transcript_32909/g.82671 Transcript_32909/m.82671 type:complete len:232 (+) Transcript_32909:537-1232(+)
MMGYWDFQGYKNTLLTTGIQLEWILIQVVDEFVDLTPCCLNSCIATANCNGFLGLSLRWDQNGCTSCRLKVTSCLSFSTNQDNMKIFLHRMFHLNPISIIENITGTWVSSHIFGEFSGRVGNCAVCTSTQEITQDSSASSHSCLMKRRATRVVGGIHIHILLSQKICHHGNGLTSSRQMKKSIPRERTNKGEELRMILEKTHCIIVISQLDRGQELLSSVLLDVCFNADLL